MRYSKIVLDKRDSFFYFTLRNSLAGCKSVLDVGCGDNSPLGRIPKNFYTEGVDLFGPSLQASRKHKIHDKTINLNILHIDKKYKKGSFDAVIALDVIEHFKKKTALQLIKKLELIARKKVILLTPNGFYPQDEIGGNPYQVHHSGWSVQDLRKLGYQVSGLRGLKYLRSDYANITWKPWFVWAPVSFVSEPILSKIPYLSYHLFAQKILTK